MLRPLLAALGLLVLVAGCESTAPASGGLSPGDADGTRLRHLDSVNAARVQSGAAPVQLSSELNASAETHARDIAVQGRAWHFGSDLTSPRERAFRAGYRGEIVGENLSEGSDSDLTVLQSWLEFDDSRTIILSPDARGLGLGWYQDVTGKIWWVQVLGR